MEGEAGTKSRVESSRSRVAFGSVTLQLIGVGVFAGAIAGTMTSGTGCGTGDSPDNDCSCTGDLVAYACYGGLTASAKRYKGNICYYPDTVHTQLLIECNDAYGTPFWSANRVDPVPCDGTAQGTGTDGIPVDCSSWDPASEITLTGGVYEVWGPFFESVIADPYLLVACDDARVEPLTGGYYEVVGAASGTMLYELGLRNGDIPISINGRDLGTHGRGAYAFGIEWLENFETEFTLVVERNGSNINLEYELVYPTL